MPESLIELSGVTKIYQQGNLEVVAVRDVDIVFERGDFAVLAGPSGSGKTTLLNLIGALDTPTRGHIRLQGKDLGQLRGRQLAELRLHQMGFVFQAYNLIPVLTAYENAEYVLILQGVSVAERRSRVTEVLEAVGIGELANRRPAELSGGQQQRVAVARAIAGKPKIVLADEPTANLDSKTGTDLIEMMRRLNREQGVTFVFSSHDPKVIDRAERLVLLEDGRVVTNRHTGDESAA